MADKLFRWFASNLKQDTNNRLVTDTEKATWNNKAEKNHTHDYLPLSGGTLAGPLVLNSTLTVDGAKVNTQNLYSSNTLGVKSTDGNNSLYLDADSNTNSVYLRYNNINYIEYNKKTSSTDVDNILINVQTRIKSPRGYRVIDIINNINNPYSYKKSTAIENGFYITCENNGASLIAYVNCEDSSSSEIHNVLHWVYNENTKNSRLVFDMPLADFDVHQITFIGNSVNPIMLRHGSGLNTLEISGVINGVYGTYASFDSDLAYFNSKRVYLKAGVNITPCNITLNNSTIITSSDIIIEKIDSSTLINWYGASLHMVRLKSRFANGDMFGNGIGLDIDGYSDRMRFSCLKETADDNIEKLPFIDMQYDSYYGGLFMVLGDTFKGLKYSYNNYILMDPNLITLKTKAITDTIEPSDSDAYSLGSLVKRWGSIYGKRVYADYIVNSNSVDMIYLNPNDISVRGNILPHSLSIGKNIGLAETLWDNIYGTNINTVNINYTVNNNNHIKFGEDLIDIKNGVLCGDMITGIDINQKNINVYGKRILISDGIMAEGPGEIVIDFEGSSTGNGVITAQNIYSNIVLGNALTIVKGGVSYIYNNDSPMTINLDGEAGDISTTILKHIKIADDANDTDYISFTSNGIDIAKNNTNIIKISSIDNYPCVVTMNKNVFPLSSAVYLGELDYRWGGVYAYTADIRKINYQGNSRIELENNIVISTHLLPSGSDAVNLGSEKAVFKSIISDTFTGNHITVLKSNFDSNIGDSSSPFTNAYIKSIYINTLSSASDTIAVKKPLIISDYIDTPWIKYNNANYLKLEDQTIYSIRDILPYNNAEYSLGDESSKWKKVAANNILVGSVIYPINPDKSAITAIGTAANPFDIAYIKEFQSTNTAKIFDFSDTSANKAYGPFQLIGAFYPGVDKQFDFGKSSNRWKSVYTSKIAYDDNNSITLNSSNTVINKPIMYYNSSTNTTLKITDYCFEFYSNKDDQSSYSSPSAVLHFGAQGVTATTTGASDSGYDHASLAVMSDSIINSVPIESNIVLGTAMSLTKELPLITLKNMTTFDGHIGLNIKTQNTNTNPAEPSIKFNFIYANGKTGDDGIDVEENILTVTKTAYLNDYEITLSNINTFTISKVCEFTTNISYPFITPLSSSASFGSSSNYWYNGYFTNLYTSGITAQGSGLNFFNSDLYYFYSQTTGTSRDWSFLDNVGVIDIVYFKKNSTSYQTQYTYNENGYSIVYGLDVGVKLDVSNNAFSPYKLINAPVLSLGQSNSKWTYVYATNGTIQTSNELKKNILDTGIDNRYEELFMKLEPIAFKWNNDTADGDKHDRIHLGLGAQTTKKHMDEVGLTAEEYALYCEDTIEETDSDGNIINTKEYGINYGQLHGLEVHMIQKNVNRIKELEDEVSTLKQELQELKELLLSK